MSELDDARKDFQVKLRKNAASKRKAKVIEITKSAAKKKRISLEDLYEEVVKLRKLLKKGTGGSEEFEITERDEDGFVKKFRVDNS